MKLCHVRLGPSFINSLGNIISKFHIKFRSNLMYSTFHIKAAVMMALFCDFLPVNDELKHPSDPFGLF